jgi:GH15 family glucan-1,4-alpha-glucosidase/glycerol uptake facilitator-like aquaporin
MIRPLLPYPPIERHGIIGDRRTAALVAADGTVDWLCLPDYDGLPAFGALLDAERGGFCRLGPEVPFFGTQRYLEGSGVLVTRWELPGGVLELTDLMTSPADDKPAGAGSRGVLRRLRCLFGEAHCAFEYEPREDFHERASDLVLWTSFPREPALHLHAGEEAWAWFSNQSARFSIEAARAALEAADDFWKKTHGHLTYLGPRGKGARKSSLLIHMLTYAPAGSMVAAPTSSLPERLGGDRNYDYRFAWVRDASLTVGVLSMLGDLACSTHYFDWLCKRSSSTESPLQVVYRIDGGMELDQVERTDLEGYQKALPVRFGNLAAGQLQLDSLGYLADSALIYLNHGGEWKTTYWDLLQRAADFTARSWQQKDNGIWELPELQHYVSSKVMSWVTLDRAVKIAERLGNGHDVQPWREAMRVIHAEVLERGWSGSLQSFRQHYDADTLDSSVLLIPVMGFLPASDSRVAKTVKRLESDLSTDGWVNRFTAPSQGFEGAFLPCTFWLATTYALAGRARDAEELLARVERASGALGIFPEELDPVSGHFLGNTPLVFAHGEYVRSVLAAARARPSGRVRLWASTARRLGRQAVPNLRSHWPAYLLEALGLGIFMTCAVLLLALLEYPGSPVRAALDNSLLRRFLFALGIGATAYGITASPIGKLSGAHINPAVTLTFLRLGKMRWDDAVFYILAQVAGGTAAMLLLSRLLGPVLGDPAVMFGVTQPGPHGPLAAFLAELVISFILMLALLFTGNSKRLERWTPAVLGMLLVLYVTFEAPLSGMSLNPARTFAAALPAGKWGAFWIYLCVPIAAMLLAAELFVRIRGSRAVACPKLRMHTSDGCIFRCGVLGPQQFSNR